MKKIQVIIVTLISFLIGTSWVNAECDAAESNRLKSLAVNVKYSYEIVELEVSMEEGYNPPDGMTDEELANYVAKDDFFRIYLSNITEDLYVVVTNENTKETKTFRYSDTNNGTISFDEKVGIEIVNYKIVVYASEKSDCSARELRTMYLTTPKYNPLSESQLCIGIEEFYLCHEYLSVDPKFDQFDTLTYKYREGKLDENGEEKKEEEKDKGFIGFIKEHKVVAIATTLVVIAAGGCITFVIVKKQRSRIV